MCPKCGSDRGWLGPKYKATEFTGGPGIGCRWASEALLFTCQSCGYVRSEPTMDAPMPLPPPLDTDPGTQVPSPTAGWSWMMRLMGRA